MCANAGFGPFSTRTEVVEEEIIHHHSRGPRRSRSHSRSETIEVQSNRGGSRVRAETIVVEETEERVEESARPPQDDIVEVIEEHSPERRPSRRKSERMSGFRTVDPGEFGGGDRSFRKVPRRSGDDR